MKPVAVKILHQRLKYSRPKSFPENQNIMNGEKRLGEQDGITVFKNDGNTDIKAGTDFICAQYYVHACHKYL